MTGTHTGSIRVRISVWDEAPDFGNWEEIVEVSFTPHGVAGLWPWGENPVVEFELPTPSYGVRWNCQAMDDLAAGPNIGFGTASPDSHELTLWPAGAAPDAFSRQSSVQAAYWNREGFQAQS
ncbi:hypothetical protein [Pseudoclavibacter sp. VKM Ac-2867]|uniref:hypothetical protein n=1 Tax=Pseudoclavibacter sp. VKM Ac-2867 TaxID=2783829 RepID=UPI00188C8D3F|nr:hypothetical protein [Pseudoclavibacter sp. VKM Ac-2867]MBF4460512.1 hypothetical protein [Pseudoclavibacter sp. VKM Ac-2867]